MTNVCGNFKSASQQTRVVQLKHEDENYKKECYNYTDTNSDKSHTNESQEQTESHQAKMLQHEEENQKGHTCIV